MPETLNKPNQEFASETILELAREDPDLLVVTSDSRGSGKLVPFATELPNQLVEVGIAEQNLVGIAAGLASTGKKVFAVSPACFLTARALEQIKNDICYSNQPVTLVGISAGVSYGALGSTHHAIHDFAVLRAINNITIVAPGDAVESREAVRAAYASSTPVYLRFGKFKLPPMHSDDADVVFGKAITVRAGNDLAFIAAGEALPHAVSAAELLALDGIACRVISMHTVKPLDRDAVLAAARECNAVITVEEHMVNGGLGEACAAVLMEAGESAKFRLVGIPDEYTVTGHQSEILKHYCISAEGLSQTAKEVLQR